MNNLPFNKPGRFYRGNLHTHSTRSDGRLSPEAVCQFYKDMGYDFIALTDHFMESYRYPIVDTSAYRTPTFTTLFGAELHAGQTSVGEIWHILAVGLPLDFAPPPPDESGPGIAARALATGALVAVAHPAWYCLSEQDVIDLGDVQAIETINGISDDHNDRIDSWYMLDTMLARGRHYTALATDDTHFHDRHSDRIRGWVQVKADVLTPESILASLKAGWFYSSTGPQIHDLRVEGNTVRLRCSPVSSIFVTGKGSRAVYKHGKGMIDAEMNIAGLKSPYCRVTIRDERGGRAWSNPIWFMV
ncbi:MAG: CehA/McbA family metallohydrolase [Chloroflexota bacterium]|nr:CehA/McbA family metallohydrolase [Chloroflexota bacterium]